MRKFSALLPSFALLLEVVLDTLDEKMMIHRSIDFSFRKSTEHYILNQPAP